MASYTVWLNDSYGTHIAVLESYLGFSAYRTVNQNSVLTMTMPGDFDYRTLNVDYQLAIYRDPGQQKLLLDTVWLIRGWRIARSGGRRVVEIIAVPLIDILRRRIVNVTTIRSSFPVPADDLMKMYASELVTPSPGYMLVPGYIGRDRTFRGGADISNMLAIEAQKSECGPVTIDLGYISMLEGFAAIAEASRSGAWGGNGTPLYFDIVPDSLGRWVFRTFSWQRGADRSSSSAIPFVVSEGRNNLADASITFDYTQEINYALIGDDVLPYFGDAYDESRIYASPINRCETFDWLKAYILDAARFEAKSLLDRHRSPVRMSGVVVESAGSRFGLDWGWGDRVVVEMENESRDVLLKTVTVEYRAGVEKISAQFSTQD